MNKKISPAYVLCGALSLTALNPAIAGEWTTQKIGLSNSGYDVNVDGSNVVWTHHDGISSDVYLYDGSTTINLSNTPEYVMWPKASGGHIVWQEGLRSSEQKLMLYDGQSTINIEQNFQYFHLSEMMVAWNGWDGYDSEVSIYDLSTNQSRQITHNDRSDQISRLRDEHILFFSMPAPGRYYEKDFYYYNLVSDSLVQLTDFQSNPQVIFTGWDLLADGSVYIRAVDTVTYQPTYLFFDGIEIYELSGPAFSSGGYAVDSADGKFLWQTGSQLYLYDIPTRTATLVADNPSLFSASFTHNGNAIVITEATVDFSQPDIDWNNIPSRVIVLENGLVTEVSHFYQSFMSPFALPLMSSDSGRTHIWLGRTSADVNAAKQLFIYDGESVSTVTPTVLNEFNVTNMNDDVISWVTRDHTISYDYDVYVAKFNNTAPIAHAGSDLSTVVNSDVLLNGHMSNDADNDMLTYTWSLQLPDGSDGTSLLSDRTLVNPQFTATATGDYTATLMVNDGRVNSLPSSVVITVVTAVQASSAALDQLSGNIVDPGVIDPASFANSNSADTLLNKLDAILKKLGKNNTQAAIDQIENDLLSKTDGCALRGAPDAKGSHTRDWITDCSGQAQVYPVLMSVLSYLK